MRKALILPARHDEKIAAALNRATDASSSVLERSLAEKEWRRLEARKRLERVCVVLKLVGRYSPWVGVALVMIWLRPAPGAFQKEGISAYALPVVVCVAFSIVSGLALFLRESLREVIADRYPSADD